MRESKEKRSMINTGIIRWLRFPFAVVGVFYFFQVFHFDSYWKYNLFFFLFSGLIYYWLWKRRMLTHDSKNLYILRGKTETVIPLSNVISIKRSSAKVNGSRYWILIYLDEIKQEKKLRFNSDFNKPFFNAVKENNPQVVIWKHPFFNH